MLAVEDHRVQCLNLPGKVNMSEDPNAPGDASLRGTEEALQRQHGVAVRPGLGYGGRGERPPWCELCHATIVVNNNT